MQEERFLINLSKSSTAGKTSTYLENDSVRKLPLMVFNDSIVLTQVRSNILGIFAVWKCCSFIHKTTQRKSPERSSNKLFTRTFSSSLTFV